MPQVIGPKVSLSYSRKKELDSEDSFDDEDFCDIEEGSMDFSLKVIGPGICSLDYLV